MATGGEALNRDATTSIVPLPAQGGARIRVEIFTAPSCSRCARAKAQLQQLIEELGPERFEYREVNIIEEIDYAVALGVLNASSIAIDGTLAFATLPAIPVLRRQLLALRRTDND